MDSISFEQAQAYLERINLPEKHRVQLNEGPSCPEALEAVTALQKYHMAAVTFDNLDMHYSSHHDLVLNTEYVYDLVVSRRRGGACPQVHQLFALLLQVFGFSAYCSGGRMNEPASPAAPPNVNRSKISYGP
jgi:arylamine N-acetyltransferase